MFRSNSVTQLFSREIKGRGLLHSLYSGKYLPNFVVESLECEENTKFRLPSFAQNASPPFALDFSRNFYDLAIIAKEDGYVHIYNADSKDPHYAAVKSFEAHGNAVFDVKWFHDDYKCLTASADQSVRLIDILTGQPIQSFYGHTMTCRSIALCPDDQNVFATSSRDGSVRIWDVRCKPVMFKNTSGIQSVSVLSNCHTPAYTADSPYRKSRKSLPIQSVTCLQFLDDKSLFSAGATDCAIKLWDFRKMKESHKQKLSPKFTMCYKGLSQKMLGYSDMVLSPDRSRLFVCCLDSVIYEYDVMNLSNRPQFLYTGHSSSSFYIKMDISPDSRYIVCGSSNGSAFIYKVGVKQQAPLLLPCSENEVSVVKWSKLNPMRVMALTDSCDALVWNSFPARRYMAAENSLVGIAHYNTANPMTPEMQKKRILLSPVRPTSRSSTSKYVQAMKNSPLSSSPVYNSAVLTPPPNRFASPASGSRQLNIARFLSDVKPRERSNNLLGQSKQMNLETLMNRSVNRFPTLKSPPDASPLLQNKPIMPIPSCLFDDEDKENIPPQTTPTSHKVRSEQLTTPLHNVEHSPDFISTPGSRKRISLRPYGDIKLRETSDLASCSAAGNTAPKRRRTLFSSSSHTRSATPGAADRTRPLRSVRRKTLIDKSSTGSPSINSYFKKA